MHPAIRSRDPRARRLSVALALLVLVLLSPLRGEEWTPTRSFRVFSKASNRGLPQSSVAALAQAGDGTLWMADTPGLLWSLGKDGRWQRHPEVTAEVQDISAARDGALWLATESGALRLAGGRVAAVGGAPLPSRAAVVLAASDGRVWVATQGCTVHWTRGGADGWHQVDFAPWPRGAFRALAEDRRGRIWASSSGGRVAFGTAQGPWTVWTSANGPFAGGVISVLADREGSVWFGLNALGLAQWVGEEWSHRTGVDPG